jgi:hypothetical protein
MEQEGRDPGSSRRYFFVHVMKTGGTTLAQQLKANFAPEEHYPNRAVDIRYEGATVDIRNHLTVANLVGLPEERRDRIRIYTGHWPYVACELLGEDFFTFTILRDPVERTISLLQQYARDAPWKNSAKVVADEAVALEELYEHWLLYEPLIHNHQTKIFSMTRADGPKRYTQVIEVDESRLALAKDNLAQIDVVGLTERYDDFLDELTDRTILRIERGRPKNATPLSEARPVSDELRHRIRADNTIDLEFYDYARGLVERRSRARV